MTDTKSQSELSASDADISVQMRGHPMTPEALKDIVSMLKYVNKMEHVRKTFCPRCRDRAIRELNAQYGVEELDDL